MTDLTSGPVRALLVHPKFSEKSFWNYSEVCRLVGAKYPEPPLGLLTVAALLPEEWQLRLVDENVRRLEPADVEWADLVLAGAMLPQQPAALALVEKAHAAGKPIVLGGPDPSEQPEAYGSADFLVLGEGEVTVPLFLADLRRGAVSGVYRPTGRADMSRAVVPRFDLVRLDDYLDVGIQFSRGCPYNCEFCDIIELFGREPRTKIPGQVLVELQAVYDQGYRGMVYLVDDNLIGNRARAKDLLAAVAEWNRIHRYPFFFNMQASVNVARDRELLGLMRNCDVRYVFLGIESPDDDVLARTQKHQNRSVTAQEAVGTLGRYGIVALGGFILGFDNEPPDMAGKMIDAIEAAGICMAIVSTLYALPHTQLGRRLQREGRLFPRLPVDAVSDIDATTGGLNFVTTRPRADIIEDLVQVIRHIYDPARYYRKIRLTATRLKPSYKHRAGFDEGLRLAIAFLRVCRKAGLDRRTGFQYWRTLLWVLARNPGAADVVVNMAAMYLHFGRLSRTVAERLSRDAASVRAQGEERFNELMLAGQIRPQMGAGSD